MTLRYTVKTAFTGHIYSHLKECDENFMPPLSSRVDLLDYSAKLFEKSVSFEAWQDNVLVGLLNAYLNDMSNQTGFITNTSILKEYMGQGIASTLLQMCLEHARNLNYGKLKLEVSRANSTAIKLYSHAGFKVMEESGESLLMTCDVIKQID